MRSPIHRSLFGVWSIAILPVALALVRVWRQGGSRERAALLLPVWTTAVVGCLSLSVSKLPRYLDPALPAVAVMLAAGCGEDARHLARRRDPKSKLAPWLTLRLLLGLALAALLVARGVAAWRTLTQPVHFNPMRHLALTVLRHREIAVYLDVPRADRERVREWNYLYMTPSRLRRAAAPVCARRPPLQFCRLHPGEISPPPRSLTPTGCPGAGPASGSAWRRLRPECEPHSNRSLCQTG